MTGLIPVGIYSPEIELMFDRQRLMNLEGCVATALHSPVGGRLEVDAIDSIRSPRIDASLQTILAAERWEPAHGLIRSRKRQLADYIKGTELWRLRAIVTLEAEAFEMATDLATRAVELANGDGALTAVAQSRLAGVRRTQAESRPDLLVLELAMHDANDALLGAPEEWGNGDHFLDAIDLLLTRSCVQVQAAELAPSVGNFAAAAQTVQVTEDTFRQNKMSITDSVELRPSHWGAVPMAVQLGLARSRLAELRATLETGTDSDLDEAITLSRRCFEFGLEALADQSITASAIALTRQLDKRYSDEPLSDELNALYLSAMANGLAWAVPGSADCVAVIERAAAILSRDPASALTAHVMFN